IQPCYDQPYGSRCDHHIGSAPPGGANRLNVADKHSAEAAAPAATRLVYRLSFMECLRMVYLYSMTKVIPSVVPPPGRGVNTPIWSLPTRTVASGGPRALSSPSPTN